MSGVLVGGTYTPVARVASRTLLSVNQPTSHALFSSKSPENHVVYIPFPPFPSLSSWGNSPDTLNRTGQKYRATVLRREAQISKGKSDFHHISQPQFRGHVNLPSHGALPSSESRLDSSLPWSRELSKPAPATTKSCGFVRPTSGIGRHRWTGKFSGSSFGIPVCCPARRAVLRPGSSRSRVYFVSIHTSHLHSSPLSISLLTGEPLHPR